jgi:hypothetical protein
MVAPLPCGKLEATRGVGARALAFCYAALRWAGWPRRAPAIALIVLAAIAVTGQEAVRDSRGLVVSSARELIVAPPPSDPSPVVGIATDAVPSHSDQLIVTVRFTNVSADILDSIRVTSPVPADLQYVPHSASGPGSEVLFSVDNGRTFGRPQELELPAPDGNGAVRGAEAADYTHVRWVLRAPLDAGALGIARFRAVPR